MSITQKHVSATYGPVPSGARLPTPAADLVGSSLVSTMPDLTPAAGRVLAQHMHRLSRKDPHKGVGDAILDIASDLGVKPSEFYGPESMEKLVTNNQPISAFLAEARRVANTEGHPSKAAHYAQGGIKEDLHNIGKRHHKPTLMELEEIRDDLERTADAWVHKKVHPSATVSRALGGAHPYGGKNRLLDWLGSGKGEDYAHIDQLYADRLHHGVETASERAQAAADIERYGGSWLSSLGDYVKGQAKHQAMVQAAMHGGREPRSLKGKHYAHIDQLYADRLHHGVETAAERAMAEADLERYGGGWFSSMGESIKKKAMDEAKKHAAAAASMAMSHGKKLLGGREPRSLKGKHYAHIDQLYADRLHHGVETAAERALAAADLRRYGGASLGGRRRHHEPRHERGMHYEDEDYRNAVLKHHGRLTAAEKKEIAADRRKYNGRATSLSGIFKR